MNRENSFAWSSNTTSIILGREMLGESESMYNFVIGISLKAQIQSFISHCIFFL